MKKESGAQKALRLMAEKGINAFAAAKLAGIPSSGVYRAIKNRSRQRCPTCGTILKERGNDD